MRTLVDRLDATLGHPVSARSLGVVRALVGAVAVLHLWPLVTSALAGRTYHDQFHHAYAPWLLELSPAPYTVLLSVGLVAALAMSIGLLTRPATAITFGVVAYHLALSTTHVHNNRAYLVSVLAVLAMSPCGRACSADAAIAARRGRPLEPTMPGWPLWLLRFQCALVYGASGFSKLVDPDWFGGTVTWGRVTAQEAMVRASVLPGPVADLVLDRGVHSIVAPAIVFSELFIAVGLWWPTTRRWAVVAAILFHLTIELSAEVQVFSYLGVAVLFVWARPSAWERPSWIVQNRRMRRADEAVT